MRRKMAKLKVARNRVMAGKTAKKGPVIKHPFRDGIKTQAGVEF